MTRRAVDFDLHGVVRVRVLDADPADEAKVARQLGLPTFEPEGEADLVIRFVDAVTRQPLTYVGLGDTGFNGDGFFVLAGPGSTTGRTRIPFDQLGDHPEILCERDVPTVPHLLTMINLVALSKDVLPLHASAFSIDSLNVLVTGWSKGGKTEALLAAMARGGTYVGDEWVYLTPDREMLGLPEPIRVWDWHLRQFPELLQARPVRDRLRLSTWRHVGTATRVAGRSRLPGAGLASRVRPMAERQAYLQVPPQELFGPERVALRAPLDATVLLLSHSSPETTIELVDQAEIADRMTASLAEERARFLAHYRQFRYAVGDRPNPAVDCAGSTEASLLADLFGGGKCAKVSHPSPCDIPALGDAVHCAATMLTGPGTGGLTGRGTSARASDAASTTPAVGAARRRRRHPPRIALVGADGAGKSTITTLLETTPLPAPVKRIYMGVNLESSSLMLPTTRLLVTAKRMRGGRPDLVGGPAAAPADRSTGRRGWRASARGGVRLAVWVLEEWLRQVVAWGYSRAGYLVVFDRHFLADHYYSDIEPRHEKRGRLRALHGWMLQHAYPKPDLVLCLDAPGSVLFTRKPESSPQSLEERRQEYLRLAGAVPAFEVIDADRPLDQVFTEVVDTIRRYCEDAAA
jgi:thymidylate kinase